MRVTVEGEAYGTDTVHGGGGGQMSHRTIRSREIVLSPLNVCTTFGHVM